MLEEATVFDREYGMDQHFRNLAITHKFAFSGFQRQIAREDLGFERERIEQSTIATNFIDLITRKRHPHDLFRSRRPDLDCSVTDTKTSAPYIARIRIQVTSATQHCNELFARQLLSGLEHTRSGVQSG